MSRRADRSAAVPLWMLYELPAGSAKLFVIAAAEGRSMNPRGTYDALGRGERPVGVRIGDVHRDRILETLDLGPRRWRQAVAEWAAAGFVHRCEVGMLFIVLTPGTDGCWNCGEALERGTLSAAPPALSVPHPGSLSAADRHERGNTQREHEEGMPVGPGVPEVPEVQGVHQNARAAQIETEDEAWRRLHPEADQQAGG